MSVKTYEQNKNVIVREFRAYLPMAIAGLLLSVPFFVVPSLFKAIAECQITAMCTSKSTPWGAVTSIFLPDGADNLVTFWVCAMMFVRLNVGESSAEKWRRSLFFAFTSYGTAIVANLAWTAVTPQGFSYGQSGVTYAFMGTLIALVCSKGLAQNGTRGFVSSRQSFLTSMIFVSTIVFTVLIFVTPLRSYIFEGPDLNAMVHEISLGLSFLITVPFYYLAKRENGELATMVTQPITIRNSLVES